MGLFSWISAKKEERAALDISTATVADNGTEDSTAAATLLQAIIGTGAIDADTAMEIPALSAAIDFVSGIVARLPVKLYREENDGSECRTNEITDDPRLRLLNEDTGDLMGAYEARAAQISDMFRYGAGYVYINKNGTNVESLHYVKYTDVSVTKSADPIFKDARLFVGGRQYDPWNFIILARKSTDGVRGVSIIDEHKTLLSSMYNTLKFENVSSKTGGNKKGFLQSEKGLTKEALATLRKAWEELYANNGNNMMVLNNGVKYTPSASTAVEMQLNQNKLTNTSQLDLAFLLSPDVISGKVSRDQFSLAMTNAVMPIVTIYQEAINRSLLLESEKRSMYFALDVNELLKGDTLTRYQAYAVGLQNNFLQLDEVRYKEDLPATGFNYITLGLNNVLLDPKTNVIYTPNTNQMVKVGQMVKNTEENTDEGLQDDEKSGIIEERKAVFGKGHKIVDNVPDGGGTKQRKIEEAAKQQGFNGNPHMPPVEIDADKLNFNNEHTNVLRDHNVTEAEAKSFVKDAIVSVTRNLSNGTVFENYYGDKGAAYVPKNSLTIKTAFKASEFDTKTQNFVEAAKRIQEDSNE